MKAKLKTYYKREHRRLQLLSPYHPVSAQTTLLSAIKLTDCFLTYWIPSFFVRGEILALPGKNAQTHQSPRLDKPWQDWFISVSWALVAKQHPFERAQDQQQHRPRRNEQPGNVGYVWCQVNRETTLRKSFEFEPENGSRKSMSSLAARRKTKWNRNCAPQFLASESFAAETLLIMGS